MSDNKDFVIKDKRVFSKEEPTAEDDIAKPQEESAPEEETVAASAEQTDATSGAAADMPLPEMNFSTFVMSLNASALLSLGLIDDPSSGAKNRNLPLAKQTIDIIGMLREKTEGNLTEDEAEMIKSILYELRMLYVKEKG